MALVTIGGVQVDEQIARDVQWILNTYPVRLSSGYRTPAHNAQVGGARGSDHLTGLGLDLVPDFARGGTWDDIDNLARMAEPKQDVVAGPFRWVGYDGDAGHGRNDHLHLSWNPGATLLKPGEDSPLGMMKTGPGLGQIAAGTAIAGPAGLIAGAAGVADNAAGFVLDKTGEAVVAGVKFVGEQAWNAIGEQGKYALLVVVLVIAGAALLGVGATRAAGGGVNPAAVAAGLKGARA